MRIISSFVIFDSSGRLITLVYSSPIYSAPSNCAYNSHIIKHESFFAYYMRILNSCVVQQLSRCQPWVSAIPAACLLCSTAVQRDIRAAWCFCSSELSCRSVECVLLNSFNAQILQLWTQAYSHEGEISPKLRCTQKIFLKTYNKNKITRPKWICPS